MHDLEALHVKKLILQLIANVTNDAVSTDGSGEIKATVKDNDRYILSARRGPGRPEKLHDAIYIGRKRWHTPSVAQEFDPEVDTILLYTLHKVAERALEGVSKTNYYFGADTLPLTPPERIDKYSPPPYACYERGFHFPKGFSVKKIHDAASELLTATQAEIQENRQGGKGDPGKPETLVRNTAHAMQPTFASLGGQGLIP